MASFKTTFLFHILAFLHLIFCVLYFSFLSLSSQLLHSVRNDLTGFATAAFID